MLEVKGYPGEVVQYIGDVPPGLNRKCLGKYICLLVLTETLGAHYHNVAGYCLSRYSPFQW